MALHEGQVGGGAPTHLPALVSQTRSAPQSASLAQPQLPLGKQAAPAPLFLQLPACFAVHSTHFLSPLQTSEPSQSALVMHCTQAWGSTLVSQAGVGEAQSEAEEQGWATQLPTEPSLLLQVSPPGQPLRPGAVAHPATQMPGEASEPLQIRPELIAPHCSSLVQPHSPVASMQMGLSPPHMYGLSFVQAVQCPASGPSLLHAGRIESEQLGQPSSSQGTHCDQSQRGVAPEQSSSELRHCAHCPARQ